MGPPLAVRTNLREKGRRKAGAWRAGHPRLHHGIRFATLRANGRPRTAPGSRPGPGRRPPPWYPGAVSRAQQRTATLLITCPDRKGIAAAVAGFLYENDANILHADQHQDAECGLFLMRV